MASIAAATAILVVFITTVGILFRSFLTTLAMKKRLQGRPPVPPGSLGLPWVGETFRYMRAFRGNGGEKFFDERQAKYGVPYKTSLMGAPMVILGAPAGNKFVFANEGKLVQMSYPKPTKALLGPDSIMVQTGEHYKSVRRHTTAFLDQVSVNQYVPMVERITLDHLATFWQPRKGTSGEEVDEDFELGAYDLMKNFTFRLMASLCLSLQPGSQSDEFSALFTDWGRGLLQFPINLPGFAYHRALQARAKILVLLSKMIAERRAKLKEGSATDAEQQDVLSHLLTRPDDTGRMYSDGEIKDNILIFMNAGHDTSRSVLTLAIRFIAQHPEVYKRLREEHDEIARQKGPGEGLTPEDVRAMKYTWGVILETMRMEPAVGGGYREATEDFEYDGYTILKGWKLMWNTMLTNKSPKFFTRPEEFNPLRFEGGGDVTPFTFVPFGGGPRLCPGNEFAKLEMLVFIHFLVRKYTWELARPDTPVVRKPFPYQENGTPIKVRKLK